MWWIFIFLGVLLSTCGAKSAPFTGRTVLHALKEAGAPYTDAAPIARIANSPLPNTYTEQIAFRIPGPPVSGGQFFVCETKTHCDTIYDYLTAFIPIGPAGYYYQSGGGRVVLQLSSSVAPETANTFATAIAPLP